MAGGFSVKITCEYCNKEIGGGKPNMVRHLKTCPNKPEEESKEEEKDMSMFVEVLSKEKFCRVMVNLESVSEIVPLVNGGCHLIMNSGNIMKVEDDYSKFVPFSVQMVTPEMVAKKLK